jgi:hypothetical protein
LYAFVAPFIDIALLRRGPQHLPASNGLLGLAALAYVLAGLLTTVSALGVPRAAMAGVVDAGVTAALASSLLLVHGHTPRIRQTITALFGVGTLISLLAMPVTGWLHRVHEAGEVAALPVLLMLGLIAWSLAVTAHVLRHALSTHYVVGLVAAVVFLWISVAIGSWLLPKP